MPTNDEIIKKYDLEGDGDLGIDVHEALKEARAATAKHKQSNLKLLREELAALEHEQWTHWTLYMLSHLTEENKMRWWKQTHIRYEDLSEGEKDKDRKWARMVLKILSRY